MSVMFAACYLLAGIWAIYLLCSRLKTNLTENERKMLKSKLCIFIILFFIGATSFCAYAVTINGGHLLDDGDIILVAICMVCTPVALIVIYFQAPKEGDDERKLIADEKFKQNKKIIDDFYNNNTFAKTFDWTERLNDCTLCVDNNKHEFTILKVYKFGSTPTFISIPFENILKCEIDEDGAVVESGGIGRAVVGGVIAGETGAIIGAVTRKSEAVVKSLDVRIMTSNINMPQYTISLIWDEVKKNSPEYKQKREIAHEIYATVLAVTAHNKDHSQTSVPQLMNSDITERLAKLKSLKDCGVITEEEYHEKRSSIINEI